MHPATRATTVAAMRSQSPLSSFLSSLLIEDRHGSTSTPTYSNSNNTIVADNALSHGSSFGSTRTADRTTPLSLPDSASTALTTSSSSSLSRWDPSVSPPVNRTSDRVHRKKRGARGSRSVSFWTSSDVPALPVRCDSPQVPRKHTTTVEQQQEQRQAKEFSHYHHRYNTPTSSAANSAASIGSASGCVNTTASPRTALPPPPTTTSILPNNLFLLEETVNPFPEQTRGGEAERIPRSTRLLSHQGASRSSIWASRKSLSQTLLSCDSDTIDCAPPALPIRQVSLSLYETIEPSSSSRCGDSSDTIDCAAAAPPVQPIRQVSRSLYEPLIEASTEFIF